MSEYTGEDLTQVQIESLLKFHAEKWPALTKGILARAYAIAKKSEDDRETATVVGMAMLEATVGK